MNVKTIFFDLDDTLWWFTRNSEIALRLTFEEFAQQQWNCHYAEFNRIYEFHNERMWQMYSRGEIDTRFLMNERFRLTLAELIPEYSNNEKTAREMNAFYLESLSVQTHLVPHAKDILNYLRRKKYQLCILSNGFKGVQQLKLKNTGIDNYFSHVILSEDCGVAKPCRGIFDHALKVTHRATGEVVMIGDNPSTDITGAIEAGWNAIYFNLYGTPLQSTLSVPSISSLESLKELL